MCTAFCPRRASGTPSASASLFNRSTRKFKAKLGAVETELRHITAHQALPRTRRAAASQAVAAGHAHGSRRAAGGHVMRLLLLNYEFPPLGGGASAATFYMARELVARGHHVEVLTSSMPRLGADRARRRRACPPRLQPAPRGSRCGPHRRRDVTWFPQRGSSAELTRAGNFDCAHFYFALPTGALAPLWVRWTKLPYVVALRGSDVPGYDGGAAAGAAAPDAARRDAPYPCRGQSRHRQQQEPAPARATLVPRLAYPDDHERCLHVDVPAARAEAKHEPSTPAGRLQARAAQGPRGRHRGPGFAAPVRRAR